MNKIELRNLEFDEIKALVQQLGYQSFRAKQLFNWVSKGIISFEEMKNLPANLIEDLKESCYLENMTIEKIQQSEDRTKKFLLKLNDGCLIESVLLKYKHGYSICVSTQVGCNMGCDFCASTIHGKERDLSAGEIIGQIYTLQRYIGNRISNVVLMGSGEPLDNYEAVLKFLALVNDERGLNISHRKITVSTVGIVPKIYELADEGLQITLAISLHESINEKRDAIIPVNKKYPIDALLKACRYYIKKTKRRITFEYALINGVNDTIETAERLSELLSGMLCHVNLIPINAVQEKNYIPSENIQRFKKTLEQSGINTTVRREMGSDINAACGQLRNQK